MRSGNYEPLLCYVPLIQLLQGGHRWPILSEHSVIWTVIMEILGQKCNIL